MNPATWLAPFRRGERLYAPLVAVFIGINLLVTFNASVHQPDIGYDADDHIVYLDRLSHGTLPSSKESREFFASPLPYAIPAVLALTGAQLSTIEKAAQFLNVLCSVLLTYFLVRICRAIKPDDLQFATWALLLLGSLTVYYRTMAFIRGEPLCAALAVIACEHALRPGANDDWRRFSTLGVLIGMMLLSKQWGMYIAIALVAFMMARAWVRVDSVQRMLGASAVMALMTILLSGWFYGYLYVRFGSPAAFNTARPAFTLANRPTAFYTDLGLDGLFTDPVRERYNEPVMRFIPLMYSDIFGDYWCYWLSSLDNDTMQVVPARALGASTEALANGQQIRRYLARLNIAGVIPSLAYAGGALLGAIALARALLRKRFDAMGEGLLLCTLAAGCSLFGYIVLLIWVPLLDVKASYALQVFPFAAVLAAAFLGELKTRTPRLALALQALLLLALAHNASAFVTRYWSG